MPRNRQSPSERSVSYGSTRFFRLLPRSQSVCAGVCLRRGRRAFKMLPGQLWRGVASAPDSTLPRLRDLPARL